MNYNKTGGGLWVPTNRGVVFSPMMSSFGGGSIRGFNGGGSSGGGAVPVMTAYNDLLSNQDSRIEGHMTHNGYGFMLYTGYKTGRSVELTADLDVSNIDQIRFVVMGGGGGAGPSNIEGASASGGLEGLLDTSSLTTLELVVGAGGDGATSNSVSLNSQFNGGNSIIRNGGTDYAVSYGGISPEHNGTPTNIVRASTSSSGITIISAADGGRGAASSQSDAEPVVTTSPTLTGAYAHGAGAGKHAADMTNWTALGYGGGGGGYDFGSNNNFFPGGPLGYRGGLGQPNTGTVAQGPSTVNGTSYGKNSINYSGYAHPLGGGGGGAFGGAGIEIYDVGQGATGLVKIWWAANDGDTSKLSTVGNLYN